MGRRGSLAEGQSDERRSASGAAGPEGPSGEAGALAAREPESAIVAVSASTGARNGMAPGWHAWVPNVAMSARSWSAFQNPDSGPACR